MGAAISIFVILSLSVFIVRIASVALRFTGLTDASARFQALSAFSGTGFTTREAEVVVNYPVRRRIISVLMIIGNMGLVTIFATVVVSLVRTDGELGAVIVQLAWLAAGIGVLWFLMLNQAADKMLCAWIGKFLERTTLLGKRPFDRLVQVSDGYSVCEHPLPARWLDDAQGMDEDLAQRQLVLLGDRSQDDRFVASAEGEHIAGRDRTLVLFGPDGAHERFAGEEPV